MKERLRRFWRAYERLMDRQGFLIVLGVCVLVIVLSAAYTLKAREALENPPLTDAQEQAESADAMQYAQPLAEALIASQTAREPLALPTAPPLTFTRPAAGYASLGFSDTQPVYFARARAWQMHLAADIDCGYGAPVSACADGAVIAVEKTARYGLCVRVSHAEGYESLYAGLADATYVRAGDPVSAGQTLGHAGDGVLFEEGAHLHWAVYRDGRAVDPLALVLSGY